MSDERALTEAGRAVLTALRDRKPFLSEYVPPGWQDGDRGREFYWSTTSSADLPKLHGTTVNSLLRRGLIAAVGDDDFGLTDAGRRALAAATGVTT